MLKKLLVLLAASAVAAAQTPATQSPNPAANPAVKPPTFDASDEIPTPEPISDAYSLDEIRIGGQPLDEDQQVERWKAELAAGRARAGALVGAYGLYRALTPADCAGAREALLKADELGSDQAPSLLAQLAGNTTCGDVNVVERERWLKKAVPLDYPRSALELMNLYANATPPDTRQRYIYARVAAGYWESTKSTQPRPGFDVQALQEMEKSLSAADRASAEAEAAKILEQMLKRHARFGPVQPVEFARGDGGAKSAYVAWQMDYRHECQWNLKNNCRGTQRLTYVDLTNKNSEFLSCKLELRERDFVTGAAVAAPQTRQVLIGPKATRRLLLGDVGGEPDKKAITASCTAVPKLAANATAGKCKAKLQGSVDVENFYPESAKRRGVEGNTVVRYWVPPGSDVLVDAEIAASSGDVSLDDAAIATLRSAKFSRECDYGLSSIRISFKLAE
jgi:TonB family protein